MFDTKVWGTGDIVIGVPSTTRDEIIFALIIERLADFQGSHDIPVPGSHPRVVLLVGSNLNRSGGEMKMIAV